MRMQYVDLETWLPDDLLIKPTIMVEGDGAAPAPLQDPFSALG
jgi:hypothetical protein